MTAPTLAVPFNPLAPEQQVPAKRPAKGGFVPKLPVFPQTT